MENPEMYPFQGISVISVLRTSSATGVLNIRQRRSSCLILKLHGVSEYLSETGRLELSAGQALFVEKGSSYIFREIVPGYSYIVNFDCDSRFDAPLAKLPLPEGLELPPIAEKLYRHWQKGNVYGALSTLYRLLEKTTVSARLENRSLQQPNKHLEAALAYLQAHLTDPELKLETLSRLTGVSDAYLRRVFRQQLGTSPAGFVLHERMQLASQLLLAEDNPPIARVALQVGYRDPLYFSRVFKKYRGVSPTEYCSLSREFLF